MLTAVPDGCPGHEGGKDAAPSLIDEIVRDGATFATVRHRTEVTKGPGSRAAGLAMAFKLIQSAQNRWRAVNAPHLVALVRTGAVFRDGVLIERPEQAAA